MNETELYNIIKEYEKIDHRSYIHLMDEFNNEQFATNYCLVTSLAPNFNINNKYYYIINGCYYSCNTVKEIIDKFKLSEAIKAIS